jgi:predicted nucleic acid-binding protein
MSAAVFVDTNIFVYACDATEALKQPIATRWIHELWAEHRGRTSTQVLNECYVTLTRKLDPGFEAQKAWEYVRELIAWEPQEITCDLLLRAREIEQRYATSWWDSLIVAAAELQDCSVLLTEDLQDGMAFGSIAVRNPFGARIADERVEYAIASQTVVRHRPRGRPRSTSARKGVAGSSRKGSPP